MCVGYGRDTDIATEWYQMHLQALYDVEQCYFTSGMLALQILV
jgi:hypothetical protein